MAGCHFNSANYPMNWIDDQDGDTLKSITYSRCRPMLSPDKPTEVDPAWKKDSPARKSDRSMPLDPGKCGCLIASRLCRTKQFFLGQVSMRAEC